MANGKYLWKGIETVRDSGKSRRRKKCWLYRIITGILKVITALAVLFVLVVGGAPEQSAPEVTPDAALDAVRRYRAECRALKESWKLAAADTGFCNNELYQMALDAGI